jgi:hypothetical protein
MNAVVEAQVRYPSRPLSDFFYSRGSLKEEWREHSVNLSSSRRTNCGAVNGFTECLKNDRKSPHQAAAFRD